MTSPIEKTMTTMAMTGYNYVQNSMTGLREPEVLTRLKRNPAVMLGL